MKAIAPLLRGLSLLALATSPALADVLIVGDPSMGGAYTTIQAAVNAAQDGDVIAVHAPTSPGFVVQGKSVSVVSWPGRTVAVQGSIRVENVPADGQVTLAGLHAVGQPLFPLSQPGLALQDNAGRVRVLDCSFEGGAGTGTSGCLTWGAGGHGATVVTSAAVILESCTFLGGLGNGSSISGCKGAPGGHGLTTSNSVTALYECGARGGRGGEADTFGGSKGGNGGHGVLATSWGVFVSGGSLRGGIGGFAEFHGDGGDGARVGRLTQGKFLDVAAIGGTAGNGGNMGQPVAGDGIQTSYAGTASAVRADALASVGGRLLVEVEGEPGDEVWLFLSAQEGTRWIEPWVGVAAFAPPHLTTKQPLGTLSESGRRLFQVPVPVQSSVTGALTIQALLRPPGGPARLSSPRRVTVVDGAGLAPDCDGNGVLDLSDVLLGTAADVDLDGVPDGCATPPATWHVDAGAGAGGNGSAGAPFQNLQAAFAAAGARDTILLADGVYTGPANRNLVAQNAYLTVRSANGPAACIVDAQLAGSFADFKGSGRVRVEGLTVRNTSVNALKATTELEVVDCVFEDCRASFAAALYLLGPRALVRGCSFVDNSAMVDIGGSGGAILAVYVRDLAIEDSHFEGNAAVFGGAVAIQATNYFSDPFGARSTISRCTFLGNSAFADGGAIEAQVTGALEIVDSLFAGNSAKTGGALNVNGTDRGRLAVGLCTFTGNSASVAGGALRLNGSTTFGNLDGLSAHLSNSILWGDTAPLGAEITLYEAFFPVPLATHLEVRHCDVQGGQGAVFVEPNGVLVWGAGNLDLAPGFADADGPDNDPSTLGDNDWRLGPGSACVDAGANPLVTQDVLDADGSGHVTEALPLDRDGLARFVDDPAVPDTGVGTPPLVDLGAFERP